MIDDTYLSLATIQLKAHPVKLLILTLGMTNYGWNKPAYIEVWRYTNTAPQTNNQANTVVQPKDKAFYQTNEVKYVNGMWQIKCDYLAPVGFDWTENGIPVSMVNWVDENGNNLPDGADQDFKAGMYFSFELDGSQYRRYRQGWLLRRLLLAFV